MLTFLQGEPLSSETPIIHNFTRKIQPGDPRKAFPTSVVVSHVEKEFLPGHMGPGMRKYSWSSILELTLCVDAQILCEVRSDLSTADERQFKRKNRHFWNTGKPYFRIDYQVKVLIGPADIRFELCWLMRTSSTSRQLICGIGFNGQKLNKDEPIKVEWTAAAAPEPLKPPRPQWAEEPVLKIPNHKPSMDFRGPLQELGNRSSPNLASPPFEMGNRSPPPVMNLPGANDTSTPPTLTGPYLNGIGSSSSYLSVNKNPEGNGSRNPSNSRLDFQSLHTQTPPATSQTYFNEGTSRSPPMDPQGAQNGYGNNNQSSMPRSYLAGFKELP